MRRLFRSALLLAGLLGGCSAGPAAPVDIDTTADVCAHCRMTIVSSTTAAQIVARGEEPTIFDDLGCLRDYVAAAGLPAGALVFVADIVSVDPAPEPLVQRARAELAHALAQLGPAQREAVVLRFAEELSYDEIAALTGVGVSALKMRVQRACLRLRELLAEHLHT